MAQLSGYWTTGGSTGHCQASYTQDQMGTANKILAACAGYQGVAPAFLNELRGTYTLANTVSIGTGGGIVDGKWYINDSNVTLTIPSATGTGNSRIDLIVLRCNWNAYTAEIAVVTGVNSSNPTAPSATQQTGSLYEIPLYDAHVSRTGVITLTDRRIWASATLTDNSVNGNKLVNNSVSTDKIVDKSVTREKIANNAVGVNQIENGSVSNLKLSSFAVSTDNIVNESITFAKMGNESVGAQQIIDGSVTSDKLSDNSVSTDKIENNSVTEAKLGTIKRTIVLRVTGIEEDVEIKDYGRFFFWPVTLHNFKIIDARINLATASTSGDVTVALTNASGLMTTLSLPSGSTGIGSSGTINSAYNTATTNYSLFVNVTAKGTGAKGLSITLVMEGVPS